MSTFMEPPPLAMTVTLSSLLRSPSSDARSMDSSWVRVENSVISVQGTVTWRPAGIGRPTLPNVVGIPMVLAGTMRRNDETTSTAPTAINPIGMSTAPGIADTWGPRR